MIRQPKLKDPATASAATRMALATAGQSSDLAEISKPSSTGA
jgi:hypothetical protein